MIRLSSLGDVILASGIPALVKRRFPEIEVAFVTRPAFAPVAKMAAGVGRVIEDAGSLPALARALRDLKPAEILDLQSNLRTRLLNLLFFKNEMTVINNLSWARRRAVRDHRRLASLPSRRSCNQEALVRAFGGWKEEPFQDLETYRQSVPSLIPPPDALEAADEILLRLKGPQPILALAPGSLWPTKQWPLESFVEAAKALKDQARLLILGSASESGLTARIAEASGPGALDLGGRTDLPLAAALLSKCAGLLCNDSGLMHMAEAVGSPVVALFGSTVPELGFRPWRKESLVLEQELSCRPCHVHGRRACPLGHFRCMKDLPVTKAVEACRVLLGGAKA